MSRNRGSVKRDSFVAIGSFDGVHRGHQQVLATLKQEADAAGAEPVVLTFEPLPREVLMGDDAPPRIQPLRDRITALRASGIERIRCLRFTERLMRESAADFVERVLKGELAARRVFVGEGFRFGHRRGGDAALLRATGIDVTEIATVDDGAARISSTRIREALAAGDLDGARTLLGHALTVTGRVRAGDARGRALGFPTANLVPSRPLALADGVYAVQVGPRPGAAHYGRRAWLGGRERRLEVHLLDFDGDLYGKRLTVELVDFIRPDEAFDDLDALKSRIALDIEAVRDTIRARD